MKVRYTRKFLPSFNLNYPARLSRRAYKLTRRSKLTKQAQTRLTWIDYYHAHNKNASLTCRHFGICRQTFYKWFKRYQLFGQDSLKDYSRAPHNRRKSQITIEQKQRIIKLRKQYIKYGKEKLKILYEKIYGEPISTWKIYRIIRKHQLYYHPVKNEKLQHRRKQNQKKKRITELKGKTIVGLFLQLDTKAIWCYPTKRYIFAAVDKSTKLAFARMYKNNSSYSARDFLLRLYFLLDTQIDYLQSDNGAEFQKYFEEACAKLNIQHYFSRIKTPDDHPQIERFNRTIEEEFLQLGNYIAEVDTFNRLLADWLIEYNFNRPHQSLGYLTPIEFTQQKNLGGLSTMCPTYTFSWRELKNKV
jgi:transposase InsO family protein